MKPNKGEEKALWRDLGTLMAVFTSKMQFQLYLFELATSFFLLWYHCGHRFLKKNLSSVAQITSKILFFKRNGYEYLNWIKLKVNLWSKVKSSTWEGGLVGLQVQGQPGLYSDILPQKYIKKYTPTSTEYILLAIRQSSESKN